MSTADLRTAIESRKSEAARAVDLTAELITAQLADIEHLVSLYPTMTRKLWGHQGDLQHVHAKLAEVLAFLQGTE